MTFKKGVKGFCSETGELFNEEDEVIGEIDPNGRVNYY